jgi:hypothetical protein
MIDLKANRQMNLEIVDIAGAEPGRSVGFLVVEAGLLALRRCGR